VLRHARSEGNHWEDRSRLVVEKLFAASKSERADVFLAGLEPQLQGKVVCEGEGSVIGHESVDT
jgi:hypothetical protein